VNVNLQAGTVVPYTPTSQGLTYSVSNIPTQGLTFELWYSFSGPNYSYWLAPGGPTSGTIPWTSFSLEGSQPLQFLTGPPTLTLIDVDARSIANAAAFDFCVTGLSL
jgi:hypothetical protein